MSNPRVKLSREQLVRLLDGGAVQVATPVGLLHVSVTPDAEWRPLVRIPVTSAIRRMHDSTGQKPPDELWHNDVYEVFRYEETIELHGETLPGVSHLSIKRYDRAPVRNWRHFQQIKNEILGAEREAVELFPRESRLADNANQYHLWAAPEGADFPVGWEGGMVLIRDDEVEMYNDAPHGGRQEPMQAGLTVGATMDGARSPELNEQVQQFLRPGGG